jgi:sulfatase maturation enzyme AslB (radical SAM superfamily)
MTWLWRRRAKENELRGPHELLRLLDVDALRTKNIEDKSVVTMTLVDERHRHFRLRLGPCGVHLFNRRFGVNVLLDEVVVPKEFWSWAPRQVSIALTNACDLNCPYCFAPKHNACARFDQVVGWLTELDENGTLGVGFGGGEPTLHPRFADLCSYAAKNTGLAVTFTTHGHRLTERLLAKLVGNVHFVRVSMDGVAGTYEWLRGRSFRMLQSQMRFIREVAPFGINYVVNADTIGELNVAIDVAAEVDASEILLLPEQSARSRQGIDIDTFRKLRDWVAGYRGPVRLAISEYAAAGMPACDPLPGENGLRAYAHITAEGIVKRTSFDASGVPVSSDGLLPALHRLSKQRS